jgi:hypothetical protein
MKQRKQFSDVKVGDVMSMEHNGNAQEVTVTEIAPAMKKGALIINVKSKIGFVYIFRCYKNNVYTWNNNNGRKLGVIQEGQ